MIPITVVRCDEEQIRLVNEVLASGMLAQGAVVEQFEERCRAMAGTRHAVAVSSGTAALTLALEALGVGPGDEVITSPFTFAATLNAVLESGAIARFADISDIDFNLDPAGLAAVTSAATRVIMPVHLYGQPAELDPIAATAEEVGAALVEDAAQAHGATYHGRPVGSWGLGCFSFYATKNLQCGEGGAITTDDDELAARLRILRNQGMRARYDYVVPGHNHRLTDLAAAVAVPQFDHLDAIVEARAANAAHYSARLADLEGVVVPAVLPHRRHVWHQYTFRVTHEARIDRDALVDALRERGVGAGVYYPQAVYDHDCYRTHPRVEISGGCPVAERVAREVISLPVHQHLSEPELETVVEAVRSLLS